MPRTEPKAAMVGRMVWERGSRPRSRPAETRRDRRHERRQYCAQHGAEADKTADAELCRGVVQGRCAGAGAWTQLACVSTVGAGRLRGQRALASPLLPQTGDTPAPTRPYTPPAPTHRLPQSRQHYPISRLHCAAALDYSDTGQSPASIRLTKRSGNERMNSSPRPLTAGAPDPPQLHHVRY